MKIDLFNYQTIYGYNSNFDAPQEADSGNYLASSTGRRLPFKRFGLPGASPTVGEPGVLYQNSNFSLVERQFSEHNYFSFTADNKITSPQDVAWMFHSLEDSSVESAFLVYHYNGGDYFVQHLGTGGITGAIIDFRLFIGNAIASKAESVTLVHNHPSGSLQASREDFAVLKQMEGLFAPTGIKVNDGIIINLRSGYFVTFTSDSSLILEMPDYSSLELPSVKVFSFDRQLFAENYNPVKINNPVETAAFISTQKYGLSDKTELIVLNNQNHITGKFLLPQHNQLDKIIELSTTYGGTGVILYGNNITEAMFKEYKAVLKSTQIDLLDAFRFQGENLYSIFQAEIITKGELEDALNNSQLKVSEPSSQYGSDQLGETEILERLRSAFPAVPVHLLSTEELRRQREILEPSEEPQPKLTGGLQDYGVKIGGARKDLYQTQLEQLTAVVDFHFIPDRERNITVSLSDPIFKQGIAQLLPFPDLEKLLDAGYNEETLKLFLFDYSSIKNKPTVPKYYSGSKYTAFIGWYKNVQSVASALSFLYSAAGSPEAVEGINELSISKWNNLAASNGDTIMRTSILKRVLDSTPIRNSPLNYRLLRGFEFGTSYNRDWRFKLSGQKFQSSYTDNLLEDITAAITKAESTEKIQVKKEQTIKLILYIDRVTGDHFIGYKLRNGEIFRVETGFSTADDARIYRQQHRPELEQKVRDYEQGWENESLLRSGENEERTGLQYRSQFSNGNVSPADFAETFGFRGIEFGNYVNNNERQTHLNRAFDGFMDMSKVLNIPPKALSLNGQLGIGFGSRGRGGKGAALAHYEPAKVVINLTKNRGAGSLAHEWWHAFDHYMGQKYTPSKSEFLSTKIQYSTVRTEIFKAYELLLNHINVKTQLRERSRMADGGKKKPYYETHVEMTARTFESYIKHKLEQDGIRNDYLVNLQPAPMQGRLKEVFPYPLPHEMDFFTTAYDRLFEAVEYKEENDRVMMYHSTDENEIFGFSYDNEIYLDKNKLNSETMIHEFGHIWVDALERNNPSLYEHGIELLKDHGREYIDRVETNPNYSKLTDEQKSKEALVQAIGERGRLITDKNNGRSKFQKFLGNVKDFLGQTFFFQKKERIKDLTFEEFLNSAVYDLLQGEELPLHKKVEAVSNIEIRKEVPSQVDQQNRYPIYGPVGKLEAEYLLRYSDGGIQIYGMPTGEETLEHVTPQNADGDILGSYQEFYVDTEGMENFYIEELNSELIAYRASLQESATQSGELQDIDLYRSVLLCYIDLLNRRESVFNTTPYYAYHSFDERQKKEFEEYVLSSTLEGGYDEQSMEGINSADILKEFKKSMNQISDIQIEIGLYDSNADTPIDFKPYNFDSMEELVTYLDIQRNHYEVDPSLAVRVDEDHNIYLLTAGASLAFKEVVGEVLEKYAVSIELAKKSLQKQSSALQENQNTANAMDATKQELLSLIPEERRGDAFHIKVSKVEAEYLIRSEILADIMNKEYGDDEEWVGMTKEDLDEHSGLFDDDYKTFEIDVNGYTKTNLEALLHEIEKYAEIPEFDVTITETLARTFTVKGQNVEDAELLAKRMYQDEKVVLDYTDLQDTVIKVSNPEKVNGLENTGEISFVPTPYHARQLEEFTNLTAELSLDQLEMTKDNFAAVVLQYDEYLSESDYYLLSEKTNIVNAHIKARIELYNESPKEKDTGIPLSVQSALTINNDLSRTLSPDRLEKLGQIAQLAADFCLYYTNDRENSELRDRFQQLHRNLSPEDKRAFISVVELNFNPIDEALTPQQQKETQKVVDYFNSLDPSAQKRQAGERLPYGDWLREKLNDIYPNTKKINLHHINKVLVTLDTYAMDDFLKELSVPDTIIEKVGKVDSDWLSGTPELSKIKNEVLSNINTSPDTIEMFKELFQKVVTNQYSNNIKM